jgi:RNA polymerase sigma-70 factor (ECF subfamily)
MRGGDAQRAVRLLDEQDHTHADGSLQQERSAARILALCRLGRTTEARAQAQAFSQRFPQSPLLAKVQASCGGG